MSSPSHLKNAIEYLNLGENESAGEAADLLRISIAHSLAGILDCLGRSSDPEPEPVKIAADPVVPGQLRECILCGRLGNRWYESTPAGLICSHYVKCSIRRQKAADS